jgi:hypothetical protein
MQETGFFNKKFVQITAIVVGVILAVYVAAALLIPDVVEAVASIILVSLFWMGAVLLYLVPSGIAIYRKHASTGGIVALNIFGGLLCGLGWIGALIWSLSDPASKSTTVEITNTTTGAINPPPSATVYQVGDVVNGHRFNGVDWVPVVAKREQ